MAFCIVFAFVVPLHGDFSTAVNNTRGREQAVSLIDTWYVDVDIEIAGVTSTSWVYCVPAPARPSYTLLLGRKWMKQVRAIGNYETGTYIIRDSLGKEYAQTLDM
jgi:hypothetical protein